MLEQAQKLVGVGEHLRVLAAHVPALGQVGEGFEGVAGAQGVVDTPVHELEQLHGELDVAKPTGAELEFTVAHVCGHVFQHAAAHGLDVFDEGVALGRLPHQWRQRVRVSLSQVHRSGHRTGFEQRLELPGLRPLFVVRHVRIKRAYQGSGSALGP